MSTASENDDLQDLPAFVTDTNDPSSTIAGRRRWRLGLVAIALVLLAVVGLMLTQDGVETNVGRGGQPDTAVGSVAPTSSTTSSAAPEAPTTTSTPGAEVLTETLERDAPVTPTVTTRPSTRTSASDPTGGEDTEIVSTTGPSTGEPAQTAPQPTSSTTLAPTSTTTTTMPMRTLTVNPCNAYHEHCDDPVRVFFDAPTDPEYDLNPPPVHFTVYEGDQLTARCWVQAARAYNWAFRPPIDPDGPETYDSDIWYRVDGPIGTPGFVADTFSARDATGKLGLPSC